MFLGNIWQGMTQRASSLFSHGFANYVFCWNYCVGILNFPCIMILLASPFQPISTLLIPLNGSSPCFFLWDLVNPRFHVFQPCSLSETALFFFLATAFCILSYNWPALSSIHLVIFIFISSFSGTYLTFLLASSLMQILSSPLNCLSQSHYLSQCQLSCSLPE